MLKSQNGTQTITLFAKMVPRLCFWLKLRVNWTNWTGVTQLETQLKGKIVFLPHHLSQPVLSLSPPPLSLSSPSAPPQPITNGHKMYINTKSTTQGWIYITTSRWDSKWIVRYRCRNFKNQKRKRRRSSLYGCRFWKPRVPRGCWDRGLQSPLGLEGRSGRKKMPEFRAFPAGTFSGEWGFETWFVWLALSLQSHWWRRWRAFVAGGGWCWWLERERRGRSRGGGGRREREFFFFFLLFLLFVNFNRKLNRGTISD